MRDNLVMVFILSWVEPRVIKEHYFWNIFIIGQSFTRIIRSFSFFENGSEADDLEISIQCAGVPAG